MERAAYTKQGGKKEQGLDLEQRELGVEHLAGKRSCRRFMERSLELICRQWEATEGFKLVLCLYLFGKLALWDAV